MRPKEFASGQGFPVFQQLQSVARFLSVCGGFAVHQVNGVSALVCGKPDAASKQVQEYIAMAREYRCEFLGISLIRSEAFQIFTGTATRAYTNSKP